jgi:hypothetical protein
MPNANENDWAWESVSNDNYSFTFVYPADKTWEEVNAKLERDYPEPYWAWRGTPTTRQVVCFKHKWRYAEWVREMREEGKCIECGDEEDECECEECDDCGEKSCECESESDDDE